MTLPDFVLFHSCVWHEVSSVNCVRARKLSFPGSYPRCIVAMSVVHAFTPAALPRPPVCGVFDSRYAGTRWSIVIMASQSRGRTRSVVCTIESALDM